MNNVLPMAALLALAAAVVPAAAQELAGTLKKIRESGAITLGHRENSIPFSYLDPKQQPIGYSMDLCAAIVEEVKKELSLATLTVKLAPVTPQTRIQLMANGTIDLECGSTTNTLTRQKQVAFAPPTFITGTRLLAKKSARVKSYRDLKGKTVVVTQGTTNERVMKVLSEKENLGIKFLNAKDHDEGFLTVESGRAAAFAMDDILLFGLIAKAKTPKDFEGRGRLPLVRALRDHVPRQRRRFRRGGAPGDRAPHGRPGAVQRADPVDLQEMVLRRLPTGESLNLPMGPLLEAVCRTNALPD
jgi:glutamate/aspartate transport system substrate-binding protein